MADDAIIIDLGIDGAQTALAAWRDMSKAISRCIDPLKQAVALTAQMAANTSAAASNLGALSKQVPGGGGGRGGGGIARTLRLPTPKPPRLLRTQKIPVPKKGPLTPQQQFANAIRNAIWSTRIGFGHGGMQVMPLVGRTIMALGKLGPIGAAAAAALVVLGAAVKILADGVRGAADAIKTFASAMWAGGGTPQQTQYGRMLGGAMGGLNLPQLATQFAHTIATNPTAAGMVASRTGVRDTGLFGPTNKLEKLLAFIEGLRALQPEDALRTIRSAGMPEDLMAMRLLPQDQLKEMRQMSATSGTIYDTKAQTDMASFQASLAEFGSAIKDLVVSVFGPYLPYMTKLLRTWAVAIQEYARYLKASGVAEYFAKFVMFVTRIGDGIRILTKLGELWIWMQSVMTKLISYLLGAIDWITNHTPLRDTNYQRNFDSAMNAAQKAQDRNTDAVNANTQAMQGMYGGGERARAFMPASWQNNPWAPNRQRGWEGAARLGAFNV